MQYLPFRELFISQRNSTFDSRYKFTAKELDNETNYTYFGARYYDSDVSIWLSIDPLSDKYPSLSPYAYCANNPVILVDPDGMRIHEWGVDDQGNLVFLKYKKGPTEIYKIDANGKKVDVNNDGKITKNTDYVEFDTEMTKNFSFTPFRHTNEADGSSWTNRMKFDTKTNDSKAAENVYNFLKQNVSVIEFSLAEVEKNGSSIYILCSSGNSGKVKWSNQLGQYLIQI